MSKTIAPQAVPAAAQAAQSAADTAKPAIIATRRRCEADGVGLSHYILMDRKAK
ncbi:modified peptide precursor CbpA [Azoarcus sp. KH32C]|uniref:modified peptide precursor CbpA n=1 Tax=Azoarcus sp. KH32C TaxID=748247 RepID=UPI00034B184D|nr:modified peptide precursor CbpA [Azoarcus sp. KH32C]